MISRWVLYCFVFRLLFSRDVIGAGASRIDSKADGLSCSRSFERISMVGRMLFIYLESNNTSGEKTEKHLEISGNKKFVNFTAINSTSFQR